MKRVPVILQMTPHECGAASLAMVLSYYGRETTVSESRRYLRSGRDGLSARAIAQAGRELGMQVRAFSMEPANLAQVKLPAIIHWNFDHFMVVESITPKGIQVVDPAIGRRKLTHEEFGAGFTGVVLVMEPGEGFKPQKAQNKLTWQQFLRYILSTPGTVGFLGQVLGASALLQVLGLVFPLFTMVLIDTILPAQDVSMLNMLGLGMVILIASQVVLGYLRSAVALNLEVQLDINVMLGFFEHMLRLPYRYFHERTSGDLIMRLGSVSVIREVLTGETVSAILDGAMVIFYMAVLLYWQPVFGAVTLVFGALQIAIMLGTTRRLYEFAERDLAAQAESQSYLVEALTGIATVKASAAEKRTLSHWSNLFFKQLNISLKRSHLAMVVGAAQEALGALAPIALLWLGALWVLEGRMSLGTMMAVNTVAISFLGPLTSLVGTVQQMQLIGANLDRIADVLQASPEQDAQEVKPAPRLNGRIEVRNAGFRYYPNAPWALRNVSFSVQPGQKIAIVGRTGSGKSTLALLLLGLHELDEGEILYDGNPLASMDYRSLRSQFGVVLQTPSLFSGSIRRNIAAHDPELPLDAIVQAAQLAVVHDEIMAMPMGYDTVIAEGGVDLAGGQRQRIAIARALAHDPAILALDEATSNLDAITESIVDQNLSGLECTRIVIAHRLSTVRNADLILVLDAGVIVERGTHEDLLALGGVYAQLVHDQDTTLGSDVPIRPHPGAVRKLRA